MLYILFATIFILLILLMTFSTIQINIQNLNIHFPKINNKFINENYKISIKLYVLNKIPLLKLKITKTLLEKKKINAKLKDLEEKLVKDRKNFDAKFFDNLKILNIKSEQFDLKVSFGTVNAACTAIAVGTVSGIIGFFLRKKFSDIDKHHFSVYPIYQNQNILDVNFNGIFQIKMIHIIYMLISKRRVNKNGRTSNRKSYAYCNE